MKTHLKWFYKIFLIPFAFRIDFAIVLLFISVLCSNKPDLPSGFVVDFENSKSGRYTYSKIKRDWPGAEMLWDNMGRILNTVNYYSSPLEIIDFENSKVLKLNYPANTIGPIPGTQWISNFVKTDEVFLSFKIFIPIEFDFVKGGKLPGLSGGLGITKDSIWLAEKSWSTQLMFHENGEIVHFLKYPNQESNYGEYFFWTSKGQRVKLPRGKWVKLTQHLIMNDPNESNGELEAWINETKVLSIKKLRIRDTMSMGIDQFVFSVFFGGCSQEWAPIKGTYFLFDDFKLWKPEM
jgi:hypothetical protein